MTPLHRFRLAFTLISLALSAAPAGAQARSGAPGQASPDAERNSALMREYERAVAKAAQGIGDAARQADAIGNPLSGPPVLNAPFSADATTTVTQTLADGTRIEQTTSSKFYRDRAGRVRVEQMIMGLGALNGSAEPQTTITIDSEPGSGTSYTLDPATRTARRGPRFATAFASALSFAYTPRVDWGAAWLTWSSDGRRVWIDGVGPGGRGAGSGADPQIPSNAVRDESLGAKQTEGVRATGRRITMTIPAGRIGNDRPIEIVDERWESPDLKMVVYSRSSDPRTGIVEYRMTNINRAEPSADLFMVPADYTILNGPLLYFRTTPNGVPSPGGRGRGGRGQ